MELQKYPLSEQQLESLITGGQLALQGLALVLSAFMPSNHHATRSGHARDTLNFKEACEYIGCKRTKFRQLVKAGDLPPGTKIAGVNQWPTDVLTAYKQKLLAKQQQEQQRHVERLHIPKR